MKRGSTFFLKGVVVLIGLAALAVCIFWLPEMARRDAEAHPETSYLQYPFLAGAYLLSVPFFVALYQAFKLLTYIDRNKAFSELSVRALKYIKYSGLTLSSIIAAGILFVILFIDDDVAGIIGMGLMCTFASAVIATFATVLQRLLTNAIAIKSENDLTV
ncbi:hypothetical protein PAECIP111893_02061 [Paenibacillus plantiphilus]|uniref:DUF2975 domain-containing protein n=1 Tax=Paenibacillus plantiphilus TaxID=2905650 RepID=A0ABN8GC00_9BACL|nr:DUF2975 domain-containing protein [Paenibacillus plantiphilus]CAH1203762.1 hypothetical protein PAECIP111893_02061 [Paenibacillus plantiphilus]